MDQPSTSKSAAKPAKKNQKKTGIIIGIVAAVVVIAAIIVAICLANSNKNSDQGNNGQGDSASAEIKTKLVGQSNYGFVTVPETWVTVTEDDEEGLQYGSAISSNGYFVSMLVSDTSEATAAEWLENMKFVFEQTGVTDIETSDVKVGSYDAKLITGYYDAISRWLAAYMFETGDGKTHYVSIEGPDKENVAFEIPLTFQLTK